MGEVFLVRYGHRSAASSVPQPNPKL